MLKCKILIFLVLCFFCAVMKAQISDRKNYETLVNCSDIKTFRAFVNGNELSYPVIELNSDQQVHFEFDLLGDRAETFMYQIIHCDAHWEQSDLFSEQFMDGFNENRITDYRYSENTTVHYVHYAIDLPNEEVNLKVSGNYILRIIKDGDRENTVAQMRFYVYEPLLDISAEIKRPLLADFMNSGQEIRLTVYHNDFVITDPFTEVKVIICQNNRPDRAIQDIKPVFVKNNELVYSFSGEHIFLGGNEFRVFNMKSLQQMGDHINDIRFVDTMYFVQLRLDERRSYKRYFSDVDINGRYVIYSNNRYDYEVSSDYAWVYFYLPYETPVLDGKLYVYGSFNNWSTNDINRLEYNFKNMDYEAKILMKQGIYNYNYILIDNYKNEVDEKAIEGSHYETENNYLFFIYFKGINEEYDRLVGYKMVNSRG